MSKAVPQSLCRGSSDSMYTRGKRRQHGKPLGVVKDDQPDAREGQAGRLGVAERFVLPGKPGNALSLIHISEPTRRRLESRIAA